MRSFMFFIAVIFYSALFCQSPAYDDLVFDEEELGTAYKFGNKNYVLLKSKKGTGGLPKTTSGDSIKSFEISDIILVYTETTEDAAEKREENNRERWENLIASYPEFFQFNTNYKNICQCSIGGDAESLKATQGFYVYFKPPIPKATIATPVKEEKQIVKEVAKIEEKKEPVKENEVIKERKKTEEKPEEKKEVVKEVVKIEKKETRTETKADEEKEEDLNAVTEGPKQTASIDISAARKKNTNYSKPKKAKNPKACRPPFYGMDDKDIYVFFKDNIVLTKKQRRQVKGDESILKLSLNFDGSIKKALVNGANTSLNELVSTAVKTMDNWNPAVKGGLTVKSEVKITLKYDKSIKGIKPIDISITPRPNPKCTKCLSDSEIFGD